MDDHDKNNLKIYGIILGAYRPQSLVEALELAEYHAGACNLTLGDLDKFLQTVEVPADATPQ